MSLPTQKEINPHDDLDGIAACKTFFGKDLAAAEKMFEAHPHRYGDDLMFMGPVAFRYYVQAAIRFLLNESVTGQGEMIDNFYAAVRFRWEHESEELQPVAGQLAQVCGYIAEHSDEYELVPKTEEEWTLIRQAIQNFEERNPITAEIYAGLPPPYDCLENLFNLKPFFLVLQRELQLLADRPE